MRRVQPQSQRKTKNVGLHPPVLLDVKLHSRLLAGRPRRPYHIADDAEPVFEYDLPDWA